MNNQVTIKQKVHQNNPIALFVKDIILKNKNRFGIKLPIVIDFVDIIQPVGTIKNIDNKYYYIPFGKNETINSVNPLKTNDKSDDGYFEYKIIGGVANQLIENFPELEKEIKVSQKYYADLFKKLIKNDVTFVKQDRRLKLNPKEVEYIVSRIRYYKQKMRINKPIIVEIKDIGMLSAGSSNSMAFVYNNKAGILMVIDYNFYNENRGNIIGNKGLDMFLVHELTHIKIPHKYQTHGKEFKTAYKKYASEITKNKDLLNYWSAANTGDKFMSNKKNSPKKHSLYAPYYSKVNIYVDTNDWTCNFNTNKGKFDMLNSIKEQNKKHGTNYVYLDVPEKEKIKFMNDLLKISKPYIPDDEYYSIMYYYIYKLFMKYGNKKYIDKLRNSNDYKQCMSKYKKIMDVINKRIEQNAGKPTQRKQKRQVTQTKFKI